MCVLNTSHYGVKVSNICRPHLIQCIMDGPDRGLCPRHFRSCLTIQLTRRFLAMRHAGDLSKAAPAFALYQQRIQAARYAAKSAAPANLKPALPKPPSQSNLASGMSAGIVTTNAALDLKQQQLKKQAVAQANARIQAQQIQLKMKEREVGTHQRPRAAKGAAPVACRVHGGA